MADYDAQPGRPAPAEPELSRAQLEADDDDLQAGLSGVASIVAGGRGVVDVLHDVAQFAVQAIPGVDGAGVTMTESATGTAQIEALAVTADFVREIDKVQYHDLNEGPCITCMQSRRPAVSGSLGSDDRWPHFGGRVARMGVHSVLSMPLVVGDQVIGAINAYAYGRDAFHEHAVRLAMQFAGPAAVSVCNARLLSDARVRTEQLQQALVSRKVIDQAIGIVRARTGVSAEEAFDRLTKMSQSENTKLRDVAEKLVDEAVRRARARSS
ncbi:MAG TPA: GAF and ANTAR domain-containing protein [Mycobacterium sp.]|jgi:GAF domain-containing protein|nr:GAF and ANTAR domain-containing protein [Mycobacterium sp.]